MKNIIKLISIVLLGVTLAGCGNVEETTFDQNKNEDSKIKIIEDFENIKEKELQENKDRLTDEEYAEKMFELGIDIMDEDGYIDLENVYDVFTEAEARDQEEKAAAKDLLNTEYDGNLYKYGLDLDAYGKIGYTVTYITSGLLFDEYYTDYKKEEMETGLMTVFTNYITMKDELECLGALEIYKKDDRQFNDLMNKIYTLLKQQYGVTPISDEDKEELIELHNAIIPNSSANPHDGFAYYYN